MAKRDRPSEKLGTLELTTALNSDDPIQAISVLERFVHTVRNERAEALSIEVHNKESALSDEVESEDEISITSLDPPAKKAKTEEWKLDTKSYNVPFVGTSTFKGDTGEVQKGKWPTGFMEAYLKQSHKAIEILGNGSNNGELPLVPPHGPLHEQLLKRKDKSGKQMSVKLFYLYIQALGEIVTCGIPYEVLKKQVEKSTISNVNSNKNSEYTAKLETNVEVNASYQQIISTIMKEHVMVLYNILNNENSNSSKQSYILIEAALTTLANLASTSIGAAREITRGLDSNLKEGVIQRLSPSRLKHNSNEKQNDVTTIDKKQYDRKNAEIKANAAYLALASVLLESGDLMIASHAISPGVKESKTRAGIAFVALRRVAATHIYRHNITRIKASGRRIFYKMLYRFFYSIRLLFASSHSQDQEQNGPSRQVSLLTITSFLQGDVLESIARNACMDVEDDEDASFLNRIRHDAQLMMMTILSVKDQSPFLKILHSSRFSEGVISSIKRNLTRCIQVLLSHSADIVETRTFILRCFNNTPKLFKAFLHILTIPEVSPSFACISSYSFMTVLIDNGPYTWKYADEGEVTPTADKVMTHILPRALTKNILSKTLQTSNALLLLECLKCIGAIMKRFRNFVSDIQDCAERKGLIETYMKIMCRRLPDLQVLLSVGRSRFNPFHESSGQIASSIVIMNFCNILQLYASIFRSAISSLQFDWMKLLPDNYTMFCAAELCLQSRLLITLATINECYRSTGTQSNTMTSSKAFCAFCSIMLQTNDPSIYENARNLTVQVLGNIIGDNLSQKDDISYELDLWVDAVSIDTLPTFCKLLDIVQKVTVQHDVIVSNAWQEYHALKTMDTVLFTPILTTAIASIASDPLGFSNSFIELVCKVATRILIHLVNPMLLASVVRFVMADFETGREEVGPTIVKVRSLVQYASSIVVEGDKLVQKACNLLTDLFGETNVQSKVAHYLVAKSSNASVLDNIYCDVKDDPSIASSVLRQCIHHSHLDLDNKINKNNVNSLYLKLFPIIIQRYDSIGIVNAILELSPSNTVMSIFLMITSSFVANEHDTQSTTPSRLSSSYMDIICSLFKRFYGTGGIDLEQMQTFSSELSFTSAILPMMPPDRLGTLLRPIVNFCARIVSTDTQASPIIHLLQKILQSQSEQYLHDLPTKSVFSLWQMFSKSKDPAIVSARTSLESSMVKLLLNYEDYGLNAAHLISDLQSQPIEPIIDTLFRNGKNNVESIKFLIALITFDASMFVTPIINRLQEESDDSSILDDIIGTAIIETNLQKSCENILQSYTIERTLKRFSTLMVQRKVYSFGTTIKAMDSLLSNGSLNSDSFQNILNITPNFLQALRKCRQNGILTILEMEFLDFMTNVVTSNKLKGEAQKIAAMLLTHLGSSSSKVLKSASSEEEVCVSFLLISAEVLKSLTIEGVQSVKPSIVKRMMISCLKLGIQSDGSISTHCLVIVRLLLVLVWDSDANYKEELFQPHQIFAMTVSHSNFTSLAMVSNCPTRRELISLMICCVSLDGEKIMPLESEMCSALLVGFNASLDADDCLLRRFLFLYENNVNNYQASYCQSNLLWGQAQLSTTHTKSQFQEQYVLGSDHGGRWEPLLEALEVRRIRQTITDFPVWETANPPRIESVEVWESIDTSNKIDIDDVSRDSDISHDESETSLHNDSGIAATDHYKEQEGLEKDGNKNDQRYSPAFVMPLILGILESFALRASIGENSDVCTHTKDLDEHILSDKSSDVEMIDEARDNHLRAYRESFAKVVYRLFQKGAISLSLSCLSSKCLDIRRLAISSLYFFLQAVKLKESHDIAQWRERPQLEMILDSVQRGLTVARAKKAKQMESDGISKFSPAILVPMLPAVSSLFLARAVIVISKPGDDMYTSMNRHFLRIQDYHGAYNDCFSLPSFMILFCSTNIDSNQARKERIWALQLLKDGVVDEYSFKSIVRRHVPALLLSSFDGFCCRQHVVVSNGNTIPTFDAECSMIVEVLQKSLDVGGMSCYNNLIKTIGLLPWIQTMLESHSKTSLINSSFFRMIQSALQSTKQFHESSSSSMDSTELMFLFDPIKLALNVICAYEMKKLSTKHKGTSSPSSSILLSTVCEILSLIHYIHKTENDDYDSVQSMFQASKNGIPILSAISFLKEVKDDAILFHKGIGALCYLPLTFDITTRTTRADITSLSDDEMKKSNFEVVEFCKMSLSYILNSTSNVSTNDKKSGNAEIKSDERKGILLSIMKRIKMLSSISTFKHVFFNSNEVAEMVILCRRQMAHVGLYDFWQETLLTFVPPITISKTMESPIQGVKQNDSTTEKAKMVRLIVNSERGANEGRKYKQKNSNTS